MDQSVVSEGTVERVFTPDIITADQHRDMVRPEASDRPEIRLMLAVMEDAVASIQRFATCPSGSSRRDFLEAVEWVDSTDRSWPYSFENVCGALSLEPETVRRGLRPWRDGEAAAGAALQPYRFPFRRVNGKRHSISIRDRSARRLA